MTNSRHREPGHKHDGPVEYPLEEPWTIDSVIKFFRDNVWTLGAASVVTAAVVASTCAFEPPKSAESGRLNQLDGEGEKKDETPMEATNETEGEDVSDSTTALDGSFQYSVESSEVDQTKIDLGNL